MSKSERWKTIEKYLAEVGYASSSDLMALTSSSKATVRRDLLALEEAGRVSITHGGAVSMYHQLPPEGSYKEKNTSHSAEKDRIAKAAAALIQEGSKIIIDSGTTTLKLVPYLREIKNLVVLTNDVTIAGGLYDCENLELIMLGGSVRPGYCSVIGSFAENQVENFNADICIIGTDAVNEAGISIANLDEVGIKRSIIRSSKKTVILADHSKIGHESFAKVCGMDSIDVIVTGKESEELPFTVLLAAKCDLIFG